MPDTPETPEPAPKDSTTGPGAVTDAYQGNWVDRYAPAWSRPYLRLSRADRPIGAWLLLLPCWWGLLLAMAADSPRLFDLWIAAGTAIGAFVMRGAGCTWNDITDRNIDAQVERTRTRPIPSGQVSVRRALVWMAVQAGVGLAVLLTFNAVAIWLGVASLLLVAIYPFAKRFTWWPQVFLGLAFNWGALLAWSAHRGALEAPAIALYLAGVAWTLFYDTIYAHQDKEDDALIGVKSTARLFGNSTHRWLRYFMVASVLLMMVAVLLALTGGGPDGTNMLVLVLALGGPWAFGWHMVWQMSRLDTERPEICLMLFRANRNTGLIPVLFFAAALIV
ncbi:MAG: 4-hydroxybenzoate octaprenyltransferase [Halocynthiibacter sp.]